jgi:hypothetical protein
MRRGVTGWSRRFAAATALAVTMLVVTGPGARATTVPEIVNYAADGSAQVLDLNLNLPLVGDLLNKLRDLGISNPIAQRISFSDAFGQVDRIRDQGKALGQMFEGTLNNPLETVTKALLGKPLPKVLAFLGELAKHADLAAFSLQDLVKVGVAEVDAVSTLERLSRGLRAVVSKSRSKLTRLSIDLTATGLVDTLKGVLKPVLDITDKPGSGLIDTLNGALDTVEKTVQDTLGIDLNLDLPKVEELLTQPLISVGLIETGSETGFTGPARWAKGLSKMVDVDIFGKGDNALVHIDSLSTDTFAQIGGAAAEATAVNRIVGLKILGNQIDLTNGVLTVNNQKVKLPLDTVVAPLKKLLVDTLGLSIEVLGTNTFKAPNGLEASAEANTIKITLAPLNLFSLTLKGPGSRAQIAGSGINPEEFPRRNPPTGLADTAYLLAGPMLIGAAILVRRFTLSAR